MKRRDLLLAIPGSVLTTALTGTASFTGMATAQDRPSARELTEAAHSYYRARRTVQARFAQHFWSRVYRTTRSDRGRVVIQQPRQIRIDYDAPNSQVIVGDGPSWLWYQPFEDGPGQYSRGSTARASATALAFLMGTVDLDQYEHSRFPSSPDDPPSTDALQLVPISRGTGERRLVLHIDNAPAAPRIVRRVRVETAERNWNRFDFTELSFDEALDPSTFRYTPPAGAREMSGA